MTTQGVAKWSWLGAMVLLVGCGGDDDDSGGPSIALDDLPHEAATTFCATIEPCFGPLADFVPEAQDCAARTEAEFSDRDFAQVQVAVDSGTVVYHPDEARACLDAYGDLGCDLVSSRSPDVCERALEGTVALGDDCNIDEECEGTAYCKIGNECPGTCAVRESEGAHCLHDASCDDGLACQDGECKVPAGDGDDCGGGVAPDCVLGFICLGAADDTHTAGTCQAYADALVGAEGEECSVFDGPLCAEGLSCVVDEVGDTGVTFVCVSPYASGAACKVGIPNPCPEGEACDADPDALDFDGTCVPLPEAGEPCLHSFDQSCATGLSCDGDTCIVVHRIGEVCSQDAGCHSGSCGSGHCQAPEQCESATF